MAIKLRTLVKWPARVEGGDGLSVTKENGVVNVDLALSEFAEVASVADENAATVLIITPGAGANGADLVERVVVADFLASLNLGVSESRQIIAGTGLTGGGDLSADRTLAFAAIADDRILANIAGSSAAPIANTLTAILDACLGTTQGAILTRQGSAWVKLDPGTSGHVLTSQGAAANLQWAAGSGSVPKGHIYGLTYANSAVDATNDIVFAEGQRASQESSPILMTITSKTKRLDATWAAGDGNGMRDSSLNSGSIANRTYHLWAVTKAGSADPDFYATDSMTAATVITRIQAETGGGSYAHAGYIGPIVRASNAILIFEQKADDPECILWDTLITEYSSTSERGTMTNLALTACPVGIIVRPILTGYVVRSTGNGTVATYLADGHDHDKFGYVNISGFAEDQQMFGTDLYYTNASAEVGLQVDFTGTPTLSSYQLKNRGFRFRRSL